jgi:flagellin-like protein
MTGHRGASRGDRGASEVISVLLMVAVTIVLAAMVGTVILNIVSDVDTSPVAGVSVDADAERNNITVTYTATQKKGTTLTVEVTNVSTGATSSQQLNEVGQTAPFDLSDGTYRVKVVADAPGGEQAVVKDLEVTI